MNKFLFKRGIVSLTNCFSFFFLFIFFISLISATSVGTSETSDLTEDRVVYNPPPEPSNGSFNQTLIEGQYVPYIGATGAVDLNLKSLTNANLLSSKYIDISDETQGYQIDGKRFISNEGSENIQIGIDVVGEGDVGEGNIFIGEGAGYGNNISAGGNSGKFNVYIGRSSGFGKLGANATGFGNTGIGYTTLANVNTGDHNLALGRATMYDLTTGVQNMALGAFSSARTTVGSRNSAIGFQSLWNNVAGSNNIAIGDTAMRGTSGTSQWFNVFIGRESGYSVAGSANSNTVIGYQGGRSLTTGDANVFIGNQAGRSQTTASNLLIIDNANRGSIANESIQSLIYGQFDANPDNQNITFNANANVSKDLNVVRNFTGNQIYGEIWNYTTNATAWTFPIASSGVYYNLTNLTGNSLNGFTFTALAQHDGGSYLTAQVAGRYKIDGVFSFEGATNNQLYAFVTSKNYDSTLSKNCYARRFVSVQSVVGSTSTTCFLDLAIGDTISPQIKNEGGTGDIKVHAVNINIVRIGS